MRKTITKTKAHTGIRTRETFELSLPRTLYRRVTPGDYFRVEAIRGELVLRPADAIDPEDAWFWTPEWQAKEQEADADIAAGRASGPFRTAEEFMRGLKRRAPCR